MKKYVGAIVLVLVAVIAKASPLLHINLGLDLSLRDHYYVVPMADVIFGLCIVAATAWMIVIGIRRRPNRHR